MTVKLAKTAGFCWGVKRAMDIALKVSSEEDAPIRTFGPLIHNRQAIDLLKSKWIGQIDAPEEARREMMVIIRAHGVTPQTRAEILKHGARLCDATCPNVIRAQKLVEQFTRQGFDAIIVGDHDHAETIGIVGHAAGPSPERPGGRAFIVESADDAASLPRDLDKVVVVAQTTQERERFEKVAARLREMWPAAEIHDTVCSDASNRQAELRELCKEVDAIVVVGGRHSANTKRLAQISTEMGAPTWLVETEAELDIETLRSYKKIGVTAGASTPQWVINAAVERLEALAESKRSVLIRAAAAMARFLVIGQFYLAFGAALLTWAASGLMGLPPQWIECGFAGLFVLFMHQFHRYLASAPNPSLLHGSLKYFYAHRRVFLTACALSAVGSMACAALIHLAILVLAAMGLFVGALYCWATRPSERDPYGMALLFKHVRGSKDLFMASAWTAVVAGAPFLAAWLKRPFRPDLAGAPAPWIEFLLAAAAVFLLVVIRSVLIDLRDIEDDLIVGRDTLPTVLGLRATLWLIQVAVVLKAAILTAVMAMAFGWHGPLCALPAVAFQILNVLLTRRKAIRHGAIWDALIDGQVIVTAAMVILAGGTQ